MLQAQIEFGSAYRVVSDKLQGWFETSVSYLPNVIIAILIGVFAFFISKYIRKLATRGVAKFTKNQTILNLISNLTAVIFSILILFLILGIFNLDDTINKLLATAGVVGLAVGLALQDPMTNLFSGVFLSVRSLYNINDLVKTNGYFGNIKNIDLRSTTLKLPTGEEVVIPNKDVLQNPLINYSVSGMRRVDLECGVSYGEDLDHVEKIAIQAINSMDSIDNSKNVDVIYTTFDSSSINFIIRYWLTDPSLRDYLLEKSNGIKRLKAAFDANDITIPFPIRTLDFGIKGGKSLGETLHKLEAYSLDHS